MPYVKSFINQSCLVSIAEFQPHSYPIFVHLDIMLGQQLDTVVDTGRAYSLHVLYHERNCNHLFFFLFCCFQVIKAINETFSFEEDLQEIAEAQESFTVFFEEKLRCIVSVSDKIRLQTKSKMVTTGLFKMISSPYCPLLRGCLHFWSH